MVRPMENDEPTVQAMLADEGVAQLMRKDRQSPDHVKALMSRIAQERTSQGWVR